MSRRHEIILAMQQPSIQQTDPGRNTIETNNITSSTNTTKTTNTINTFNTTGIIYMMLQNLELVLVKTLISNIKYSY